MKKIRTHYDNLKVARNAPPEVIRAAYKTLSQKHHPDRHGNSAKSQQVMKIINKSYSVLIDPEERKKHDEWIRQQEFQQGSEELLEKERKKYDAWIRQQEAEEEKRKKHHDDWIRQQESEKKWEEIKKKHEWIRQQEFEEQEEKRKKHEWIRQQEFFEELDRFGILFLTLGFPFFSMWLYPDLLDVPYSSVIFLIFLFIGLLVVYVLYMVLWLPFETLLLSRADTTSANVKSVLRMGIRVATCIMIVLLFDLDEFFVEWYHVSKR